MESSYQLLFYYIWNYNYGRVLDLWDSRLWKELSGGIVVPLALSHHISISAFTSPLHEPPYSAQEIEMPVLSVLQIYELTLQHSKEDSGVFKSSLQNCVTTVLIERDYSLSMI